MTESLALNFIYSYKTVSSLSPTSLSGQNSETPSCYQIVYFFSDSDKLTWEKLKAIFEENFRFTLEEEGPIGPFESLTQLSHYVGQVCTALESPSANILSVHDYNQALISTTNLENFHTIFENSGKKFLNSNLRGEKSSFLKKIFRDS